MNSERPTLRKHVDLDHHGTSPLHQLISHLHPMPRWQKLILGFCFLGVIGHFTLTVFRVGNKVGDFDVNREFGRCFLAGEYLYKDGQCFNYMAISAMYWSPLALAPPRVAMASRYVVALLCLGLTLRFLRKMVFDGQQAGGQKTFIIAIISLVLAIHYLVRDLDDGGPHVILLAMIVGGVYCVWRGQEGRGALWLGLAIAVKMTPGLFLPFLLWKRQWRLAAYTSLATLGWIVLPAVWMGPASCWRHQQEWNRVALSVFRDQPDRLRDDNELRVQNQALKPAIVRFLVTHPPGHPLRLDHAGYRDFLNLKPTAANGLANLAMVLLWCGFCWKARKTYCPYQQVSWLKECAALLLLMLLFSPVTWLQHVVLAVPAIYLIVSAQKRLAPLTVGAMAIYVVLSMIMNRELLGRSNYLLLLSYHAHTGSLLLLLLLSWQMRVDVAAADPATVPFRKPETSLERRAA
jgi:hypothetical protein